MPAQECPQGHDTSTSAARDGQGHCRECERDRQRRRRVSDGMKLTMAKAFESAGVRFEDDDGQPVAPTDVVRQLVEIYTQ